MRRCSAVVALVLIALPSPALAFDLQDEFGTRADETWLVDHLETVRRTDGSPSMSFHLASANVWTRGLELPEESLPVPPPLDQAMGAHLRPFRELDLLIGTELSLHEDTGQPFRSAFNWQFSWSHASELLTGLTLGFGTSGSVETLHGGLSQSISGSVGIPLMSREKWKTRLRLSPHLSYDAANHTWHPSLAPELVSETVLNSSAAPFTSLLKLTAGYALAPDARPAVSARVELLFLPRP